MLWKTLGLGAVLAGALLTTGCMTSPYDGEVIGNHINDTISVSGFLVQPNQQVVLQARAGSSGSWVTVGSAVSKSYSYHWDGVDWHPWHTKITIPRHAWTGIYGGAGTHLRALVNGSPIRSFKSDFNQSWDPNESLGDLWDDSGSSLDYVRLYAIYN